MLEGAECGLSGLPWISKYFSHFSNTTTLFKQRCLGSQVWQLFFIQVRLIFLHKVAVLCGKWNELFIERCPCLQNVQTVYTSLFLVFIFLLPRSFENVCEKNIIGKNYSNHHLNIWIWSDYHILGKKSSLIVSLIYNCFQGTTYQRYAGVTVNPLLNRTAVTNWGTFLCL